jgi:hypothetical protein
MALIFASFLLIKTGFFRVKAAWAAHVFDAGSVLANCIKKGIVAKAMAAIPWPPIAAVGFKRWFC